MKRRAIALFSATCSSEKTYVRSLCSGMDISVTKLTLPDDPLHSGFAVHSFSSATRALTFFTFHFVRERVPRPRVIIRRSCVRCLLAIAQELLPLSDLNSFSP